MTFNEFVKAYTGKKLDFDNHYGGQCVDLFRFYVHEVLDKPQPKPVVGAADFWTNYDIDPNLKNNFEKILNTPVNVPKAGDVMIWSKKAGGGFGHVGVFIEGDVNRFKSFDQNWRALNVSEPTEHNYTNVLGWLRPREETMSDLLTYLGVTTDSEAKLKLNEHLGEDNGKCNWGMTGDKGGYLGSERQKNKTLTEQNSVLLAQNNSHVTELTAQLAVNAQLEQDIENLKAYVKQLEEQLADSEATDPGTDPAGWVKNGLTKEEVVDGTKWITNYKRA